MQQHVQPPSRRVRRGCILRKKDTPNGAAANPQRTDRLSQAGIDRNHHEERRRLVLASQETWKLDIGRKGPHSRLSKQQSSYGTLQSEDVLRHNQQERRLSGVRQFSCEGISRPTQNGTNGPCRLHRLRRGGVLPIANGCSRSSDSGNELTPPYLRSAMHSKKLSERAHPHDARAYARQSV